MEKAVKLSQVELIKKYIDDTVDALPTEQFLDQTKTEFVNNFIYDTAAYPDSTDPNLNGKPVLVLALKTIGDTETIKYNFVSLDYLVTIYTGKDTASMNVAVSEGKISADVKISAKEGNILSIIKEDGKEGVYVPSAESEGCITDETLYKGTDPDNEGTPENPAADTILSKVISYATDDEVKEILGLTV